MFRRYRAHIASASALGIVLLGGLLLSGSGSDDVPRPQGSAALASFDDCAQLADHLRAHGRDLIDARRESGYYGGVFAEEQAFRAEAVSPSVPEQDLLGANAADGAESRNGSESTRSETGTTIQVAGVDEADLAKRVDDLVLSVGSDQTAGLRITRVSDGSAKVLSTLPTPGWVPSTLVVDGVTAVLIGRSSQGPIAPSEFDSKGTSQPVQPRPAGTRLMQVDLTDPVHPVVVSTLDLDGDPGAARLVDGVFRVAVTSAPSGLDLVDPTDSSSRARTRAWEENRKRIEDSTVRDWLPSYRLWQGAAPGPEDRETVSAATGQLLDCEQVRTPAEFSGLVTTSLVSADLRSPDGIRGWRAGGVLARGKTMYSTAEHTYLATTAWPSPTDSTTTDSTTTWTPARTLIHLFDTTGRQVPRYLASGEVPGTLLNQFALDEFDGMLRVASTTEELVHVDPEIRGTEAASGLPPTGQAQVTVLRQDGNRLVTVGSVDGLGIDERIFAVRFLGEVGYVVTFRQTDPLYVVDLRDPTTPEVTGELKLLGYSAYLHPLGSGRLLGVGRDATAGGRTTGLAVSLFDVSDPTAPTRTDQTVAPDAWSSAEQDHHAVTVDGGLLLLPLSGATVDVVSANGLTLSRVADSRVLAIRVDEDGLGEPTQLRMYEEASGPGYGEPYPGAVLRTFVVNGEIWTLTRSGVAVHDANTLRWRSFVPFTSR